MITMILLVTPRLVPFQPNRFWLVRLLPGSAGEGDLGQDLCQRDFRRYGLFEVE
jgi:hypothetical protein